APIMWYFRELPVISSLVKIQRGETPSIEDREFEKQLATAFVSRFKLKYILLYKQWLRPGSDGAYSDYLEQIFEIGGHQDDGEFVLYTLLPPSVAPSAQALAILSPRANQTAVLTRTEGRSSIESVAIGTPSRW